MKFKALALAAFGGFAAGQAFAQGRDMTITHETPSGAVVTKHIRTGDGGDGPVMHRTTRPGSFVRTAALSCAAPHASRTIAP
jgi:hypothetical protein